MGSNWAVLGVVGEIDRVTEGKKVTANEDMTHGCYYITITPFFIRPWVEIFRLSFRELREIKMWSKSERKIITIGPPPNM